MKENADRKKKKKKVNSALQLVKTDFWSMMGEERRNSFMAEIPIIKKTSPLICRANQRTGFYTTRTSVMRVNALLLVCIYRDIFLD